MDGRHTKYLVQDPEHPYPHIGRMFIRRIKALGKTRPVVAKALGVTYSAFVRYQDQPSLQAAILWKAGLVLKHNFFEELSEAFPYHKPIVKDEVAEAAAAAVLAAKDQRIADLEKEVAIYKEVIQMMKPGS